MNVLFAGKTEDRRALSTYISRTRPGDIVVLADTKFEVETVQTNCPYIENLAHTFCNVVLKDELGNHHYSRSIFGKVEVYRKR